MYTQTEQEISYKLAKDLIKTAFKTIEVNQKAQRELMKKSTYEQKSRAQSTHFVNRFELRHYYIAYSQFRKTHSTYSKELVSVKDGTIVNQQYIQSIIDKYYGA